MEKNCLTCKWEPKWKWIGAGKYKRRSGRCRFPFKRPDNLPQCFYIENRFVEVFSDDSGMRSGCKGWEAKEIE